MHVHVWFVPPQINHAIHAYRLALPLYDGKNCVTAEVHTGLCIIICFIIWICILQSFLNFILAKLCVTYERQMEALQYLVKLLGSNSSQSFEQQLTSLKSYLTIEKVQ